jgi:hypothetical protein
LVLPLGTMPSVIKTVLGWASFRLGVGAAVSL